VTFVRDVTRHDVTTTQCSLSKYSLGHWQKRLALFKKSCRLKVAIFVANICLEYMGVENFDYDLEFPQNEGPSVPKFLFWEDN